MTPRHHHRYTISPGMDWDAYHRFLEPQEQAVELLRRGDPAGLPVAVAYLVELPWFFGSGYLFQKVAAAVATGPHAGPFIPDIHAVVLRIARVGIHRGTRYAIRLAARYWDKDLEEALTAIETPAARRILERVPGVRSSYRGIGLVPAEGSSPAHSSLRPTDAQPVPTTES